jgi:F-type H+-transporting ATPase subunit b
MELFTPDIGLLIWMLIPFLVVFFILGKFAWPAILKGVNERSRHIEESLAKAEKARAELENVKADSERIIDDARKEHIKMIGESNALKEQLIKEAKEKAEQEAAKIIDEARLQIQSERDAALQEIRNQVAALSVDIAEKLLQEKLSEKGEQEKMIAKLLDEINSEGNKKK